MSTEDTERELRALFAAEAAAAPSAAGLADGALRRARRARRVRAAGGVAGLLVAAVAAGALVLGSGPGDARPAPPAAASSGPAPQGEVLLGPAGDCAREYSPAGLPGHDFAVDGTVVAIGPEPSAGPEEPQPRVEVTLDVHEWFHGGAGETGTVLMYPPTAFLPPGSAPVYAVGSRLLLAGMTSRDGRELVPSGCGFTRYHDRWTADGWREAVASGPAGAPPAVESLPAPAGPTGPTGPTGVIPQVTE